MTTVLITGATRGLGLATARALSGRARLLVSGPDPERTRRAADAVGGEPVVLDLGSLEQVREVAGGLGPVDALACNAGIQLPGALTLTQDGFERTFQVNHLAHVVLLETLLARAEPPARVVLVGSATHDPAQRSGLPAPYAESVERIARGGGEDHRSAGRRRYSTSKLLVTALTPALARQHPDLHVSCLDPGLMTATGLSREYAAPLRRAFAALGPLVARLPFASTPERSAAVLASLLVDAPPPVPSGSVVDHRGRMARVSDRARDRAFQDDVLAQTLRLSHVVDEQVHL